MFDSTKKILDNWKDFEGKTSRSDFWWGYLGISILTLIVGIIPFILAGFAIGYDDVITLWILAVIAWILYLPAVIFITIATIAAEVRRLRDAGFPWWAIFVSAIPSVGGIALIVFLCLPTTDTPVINFGTNDSSRNDSAPKTETTKNYEAPKADPTPAAPVVDVAPEELQDVITWKCQNCGAENEGNFCGSCGTKKPE